MSAAKGEQEYVEVSFVVEANYAGWRLDRYLCEKIRRLSRTRVQEIIARDLVCDRKLKPSTLVTPGLAFRLRRPALAEPDTPRTLPELYSDDAVWAFDKPAGLPIHPTARYHAGTVVSLLKERFGAAGMVHPAHRLDRETSGVLVCARSAEVSRRLMRAFAGREVEKQYLAVVEGWPAGDRFDVDAAIAEGTAEIRIAVRIDAAQGKPARTRFEVVRRFLREQACFALVRAFPETGRQHQIRVHLREAGHPVVGDKMYGPDPGYFDRFSRGCLEEAGWQRLRLGRHALHAAQVELPHPLTGAPLLLSAPLPADLADFLEGRPLPPLPPSGSAR